MKARWIAFRPDEWLAGTVGMPFGEIGVYITICALIYSRGGPIPDNERWLTFACGCGHWRTFRVIRRNLIDRGKITIEGDKITVKRCIEELQKAFKRSSEASQNAFKRWSGSDQDVSTNGTDHNNTNGLDDAEAVQVRTANTTTTTTTTVSPSGDTTPQTPRKRVATVPEGFDAWWAVYPHKVGKGSAKKAWVKAASAASLEDLIAGVQRYIAAKPPDVHWCHPSRWLNDERWLDEPDLVERLNGARFDRNAEAERGHRRALDILAKAAIDHDERQGDSRVAEAAC